MIPFVVFALINCWVIFGSKKSFGITLPATLTGTTLVIYFSQLIFHTFNIGIWLCIGTAAAALILLVVRRKDHDFISQCFSDGFFVFLAICLIFLILDSGRWLSTWDEYSHWGKMVKEMLRIDRFYSEPQSNLLAHKDYPPFVAVFEMLWCRLSLKYSEGNVTTALHVFGFSMILPLVAELLKVREKTGKLQRFFYQLIMTIVFLLLIFNFDYVQAMTINLDLVLPLFYVALVMLISDRELRRSGLGFGMLLLGQFGLMITKQMGIAFVLLVWFFYAMTEAMEFDKTEQEKMRRMLLMGLKSLAVLVVPMISYTIWGHYISKLGLQGQFSLDQVSIGTVLRILAGGGDYVQHLTFVKYIRALFTTNISTGLFPMTYVSAVILAFCILAVLAYFFRTVVSKGEILQYAVLFALGSVGYALAMLTMYMFCFTEGEMSTLASYERYMSTYLVSEYAILLLLLLKLMDRKNIDICSYRVAFGLLAIGLLLPGINGLQNLMPQMFREKDMVSYRDQAESIQQNVPEGTTVFLISIHNDVNTFFTGYYLDDRCFDGRYIASNVANWGAENTDYWNDVLNCIREDGYVYICDATEAVQEALGVYAEDAITDQTLYVAGEENGELRLQCAW